MALRTLHPLKGEAGFTWRGGDPTRVEALSDMVFAFALTLLVVSSEPPSSFVDLTQQLWGFPGFAAAFALLLLVWHSHYIYFRRYALEDFQTTVLNAGLLFIILFFVYPLKYLATMLSLFVYSIVSAAPRAPFSLDDARASLIVTSVAYAAVFLMFALLYRHALNRAEELDLNAEERALTRFSFWQQIVHVFVGSLAAIAALTLPIYVAPFSGFVYFLIWPLILLVSTFAPPKARAPKSKAPTSKAPRPSL